MAANGSSPTHPRDEEGNPTSSTPSSPHATLTLRVRCPGQQAPLELTASEGTLLSELETSVLDRLFPTSSSSPGTNSSSAAAPLPLRPEACRFIGRGKQLANHKSLRDNGVHDRDCLNAVFVAPTPPPPPATVTAAQSASLMAAGAAAAQTPTLQFNGPQHPPRDPPPLAAAANNRPTAAAAPAAADRRAAAPTAAGDAANMIDQMLRAELQLASLKNKRTLRDQMYALGVESGWQEEPLPLTARQIVAQLWGNDRRSYIQSSENDGDDEVDPLDAERAALPQPAVIRLTDAHDGDAAEAETVRYRERFADSTGLVSEALITHMSANMLELRFWTSWMSSRDAWPMVVGLFAAPIAVAFTMGAPGMAVDGRVRQLLIAGLLLNVCAALYVGLAHPSTIVR